MGGFPDGFFAWLTAWFLDRLVGVPDIRFFYRFLDRHMDWFLFQFRRLERLDAGELVAVLFRFLVDEYS